MRRKQGANMYKVIMVPTQGSETERSALSVAVRLARRFGAEIRLVQVETGTVILEANTRPADSARTEALIEAERLSRRQKLEALGSECRAWGVTVATAMEEGLVAQGLTSYAERNDVDLIVMSSHSRGGLKRISLGSVTDFMIRNTHVPVLVVRPPATFIPNAPDDHFGRILVPLDGSALSEQILPQVEALAIPLNATVSLLQVLTPFTYSQREIKDPAMPWWETEVASGESYLSRVARYLTEKGLTVQHEVVIGDMISDTILQYAVRARIDLIAIATSGTGGFRRLLLGTVADAVTRKSQTSVLVFHPSVITSATHERINAQPATA